MRCPLITLFLSCFFYGLSAQGIEDLEQNTLDVDRKLEQARQENSLDERYALAQQSLAIAKELRYEGGIARASMLLGEVANQKGLIDEALQHYLLAENKFENLRNSKQLLLVEKAIGDLFFNQNLYEPANRYYLNALKINPQDLDTRLKSADALLYALQFDSAEAQYKKVLTRYSEAGNYARLVPIYEKIAQAYEQTGQAAKSLYYYLILQDIIEKMGTPQERALLYNNLGKRYASLNDYTKALEYFRKSELSCAFVPCDFPEVLWANMGIALHNTGNTKEGLDYLLKARKVLEQRKDHAALANLEHLLAGVYLNSNQLFESLLHDEIAIDYARETKDWRVLAEAYRTGADLYHELYNFEKAFEYYREYLNVLNTMRMEDQAKEQRLNQQRNLLSASEGQFKFLIASQNFKDLEFNQIKYERERLELMNKNLALESQRREDEVRLLEAQQSVDQAQLRAQTLLALEARQRFRLADQQLGAEKQNRLIIELREKEQIERAQYFADSTSRAQELERVRREQADQFRNEKESNFHRFAYIIGSLLLLIVALALISWWFARRARQSLEAQNKQIQTQNLEIQEERRKSDQLLLNILPEEIASELKVRGHAPPRLYESATVLFSDFVNFTRLSTLLTPKQLIDELNECFLAFDEICERHGLEKIKTIGDAYMCAGGLPVPNDTHALDAVAAAMEMFSWLECRRLERPQAQLTQMRIGIHTGPVMAGVIGKNKFAYDIWGDAVNLAARLEEHGAPGQVNISSTTAEAIKHRYFASHRGQKQVHNKGMVDMYFVEIVV